MEQRDRSLLVDAVAFSRSGPGPTLGQSTGVLVLASADLAHVGIRFGDAEAPNRFTLETLAEEDRRLLEYAERMDAEGFYEVLQREKDRRRICGLSAIYTVLRIVDARRGKILQYGQAMDAGTQSVVTFASLGFFS